MKRLISIFCVLLLSSPVMAEGVIGSAFGFEFGKTKEELESQIGTISRCQDSWMDTTCYLPMAPKMVKGMSNFELTFDKPSGRLSYIWAMYGKNVTKENCPNKAQAFVNAIESNRNIKMEKDKSDPILPYWSWTAIEIFDLKKIVTKISVACSYGPDDKPMRIAFVFRDDNRPLPPKQEAFELKGDTSGL